MTRNRTNVGVIGVGSMGQHHARVYRDLNDVNLVGIADADPERASEVAEKHGTEALETEDLLEAVDAVSVVVPTEYHYDMVTTCLEEDIATFVEKPVLGSLDRADDLLAQVKAADVPVQVGHIERFNPAVTTLSEIVEDLSLVSIRARRLGPEPDRKIEDSAVIDLMIHDIDIVLSLFDETPTSISGSGVREGRHASALLEFEGDRMASLTASRKTQRKVRTLEITAKECFIEVDYLDQSIEIHRSSVPEYIEEDGDVRFKHEGIVERPVVQNGEPLQRELESFLEAVKSGTTPEIAVQDGLNALSVALEIEREIDPEIVVAPTDD
ncbi:Gfo/Idh/MocA family oxidoreductase [Halorubrum sp. ASP121]|uniref:Gfo/Idh/MocA family protein n=1 Tax=Halorubrum sp. ASP121 TaxID=1855858 RepID=UPI0010F9D1D6|nr:Gfo/Idh/MocA family oxidoreductase [Halorubrum sp. ASP121]TKX48924.1 Gfo/Idh/MocA family oxidoreductase [Halorubrum sp. ASP121]